MKKQEEAKKGLTIGELCERAYATSEAKGFGALEDGDYGFPARVMHVVGHLASAIEHDRCEDPNGCDGSLTLAEGDLRSLGRSVQCNDVKWIEGDKFRGRLALVMTELVEAQCAFTQGKPEAVAEELADCFIRLGDICKRQGIDIEAAIRAKMDANDKRPRMNGGKKY